MADTTSLTLLERLQSSSDNEAWKKFETTYRSLVIGFLRRQGVHEHDSADVCQEVLIVVHRKIGTFSHNGRKGAFRKWLRKVVAAQLGVFRRRTSRRTEPLLADIEEQLGKPDSALLRMWNDEHDRATLQLVVELLRGVVSERSLAMFVRSCIDNIPTEQVAQEFETTRNAVVVAKAKALKKARKLGSELLE